MATEKLGLPTITGNMTADVVRDLNALANGVDAKAGTAGGLATLGADGKLIPEQTPAIADASTAQKGIVQLTDSVSNTSKTTAATPNSVKQVNDAFVSHKADTVSYSVYKSNLDANGIYTTVDHKRTDGSLILQSVLSGGTSPQYTTRAETYYKSDGTTVDKTVTYTISYDVNGMVVSEVMN